MSWLNEMFIEEAKHALNRHAGGTGNGTGGEDVEGQTYILIDEEGNEIPAVYTGSEIMFDATANDIREGKTAVTGAGVTTGTKEIPAYITTEGYRFIPVGKRVAFTLPDGKYAYTKLQAIVCAYNTTINNSVFSEKVCIDSNVYSVGSIDVSSVVTINDNTETIDFGFTNEGSKPVLIRFFTYKEEY